MCSLSVCLSVSLQVSLPARHYQPRRTTNKQQQQKCNKNNKTPQDQPKTSKSKNKANIHKQHTPQMTHTENEEVDAVAEITGCSRH